MQTDGQLWKEKLERMMEVHQQVVEAVRDDNLNKLFYLLNKSDMVQQLLEKQDSVRSTK